MSEVNLAFTVTSYDSTFTVDSTDLTFSPSGIQLQLYTGGYAEPGGTAGQLQYNNGSSLQGVNGTSYTGGKLTLGPVGNVRITGGQAGYFLSTNGLGTLSWQPNPAVTVPGGNSTSVQFNNNGSFDGSDAFTFNSVSNLVSVNNITASGNVTIQRAMEKVTSAIFASDISFRALDQSIINFSTECNSNFTVNFIGNFATTLNSIMEVNQCMTFALFVKNGPSLGYYCTNVGVDGTVQTVRWINGAPVAGSTNATEIYNFTIIKTADATFEVTASRGVYQ